MEKRNAAVASTRRRILWAVKQLLLDKNFREVTIDAVARAADVSRLTVYYQFGPKARLMEMLYDDIASRAHLGERIPEVFRTGGEPVDQLHRFMRVFVEFWNAERGVIRRLHALAAIDDEIGYGIRARNQRRREGLKVLVERYDKMFGIMLPMQKIEAVDKLHMLTSFETFDVLKTPERSVEDVLRMIRLMGDAVIHFPRPVARAVDFPKILPRKRQRKSKQALKKRT
jgi:AcrR family transcriptional regulator